jgi:hypothetical protein
MLGMIACTKLFVIDDVRLVIFKGTLNFIDFSALAGDFWRVLGSIVLHAAAADVPQPSS